MKPLFLFLLILHVGLKTGWGAGAEPLTLAKNADGKDALGVVYAYDQDFFWQITFRSTLNSEAIASLPNDIQWRVMDAKTQAPVSAWLETDKDKLLTGQFKILKASVLWALLPHQKDLELQFGVEQGAEVTPKYLLPLGEFCRRENSPQYFKNLTENSETKRCAQISERDLRDHLVN